jgi:hypothetical protein
VVRKMSSKPEYTEITRAEISEKRHFVVSSCSKGGYTLAQTISTKENDEDIEIFLKGAIHVADLDYLYEVRDAINVAIEEIESSRHKRKKKEK